jgi:hypothetical protein
MPEPLLAPEIKGYILKLQQLNPDAPPYTDFIERSAKMSVNAAKKCVIEPLLESFAEMTLWGQEIVKYATAKENERMQKKYGPNVPQNMETFLEYSTETADINNALKIAMAKVLQDKLTENCSCRLTNTRYDVRP